MLLWHWVCVESPFSYFPQTLRQKHTHAHRRSRGTMEFLIFPKWQHGMEKVSTWRLTRTWHTHTHMHSALCLRREVSAVCLCALCVLLVPSIDDQGARKWVCVSTTPDSDRLRPPVECSKLCTKYTLWRLNTHTHRACSGLVRVSVWFAAYHYALWGKPA